jgi:hypothetical protein
MVNAKSRIPIRKTMMQKRMILSLVLTGIISTAVSAEQIDLSNAKIVILKPKKTGRDRKADENRS